MKPISLFFLMFFAMSCSAQVPSTSAQVDDVAKGNRTSSDLVLVKELNNVEARISDLYTADKKLGQALITQVRSAQDAWTTWRDNQCALEAFQIEKESIAYTTTINNCVRQMNQKRLTDLKKLPL